MEQTFESEKAVEKFNPTKQELLLLADQCRGLKINGVDDKSGYEMVHAHRIKLKGARVTIEKTGKAAREEAIAYQKKVIEYEKELIGIIEPLERELQAMQKSVDEERERLKRVASLPERKEQLLQYYPDAKSIAPDMDDFLLSMSDDQFLVHLNEVRAAYLNDQEARVRAEQEKVAAERRALEEEKLLEEQRKREAAEAAERAKQAEEAAKQAVIDERERVAAMAKKKQAEEEAAAKRKAAEEAAEQERMERRKKYQNFLTKYGYSEDTKSEFHIDIQQVTETAKRITLYKKVGEVTL